MRILLVHSGAAFSTADVYDGLAVGLRAAGVELVEYRLDRMITTLGLMVRAAVDAGSIAGLSERGAEDFLLHVASAELLNVAVEQEVEAVVAVSGLLLGSRRPELLRKLGIPIACYGTEAPYFMEEERMVAPFYTHWFTNERNAVEPLSQVVPTFYLPHAYNPEVHRPGARDAALRCDAVFVGSGFPERRTLFDAAGWDGIAFERVGTDWSGEERPNQGAVRNRDAVAWYRSARIAINHHRTSKHPKDGEHIRPGSAESLGPRAYEIPACGGFMLCDDSRPELSDVFGGTVPTYKSGDGEDLERQVRHWLRRDDEREELAQAQQEAVRPHSWVARARELLTRLID